MNEQKECPYSIVVVVAVFCVVADCAVTVAVRVMLEIGVSARLFGS